MRTSRRVHSDVLVSGFLLFFGCLGGALADPPAGAAASAPANSSASDAPKSLPQDGFFSSLKQALKQGYDREVVRGHFDLGSPPNVHRYYCLMDTKTGNKEPNGVVGDPVALDGGMTGIKNSSVSLYSCANAGQHGMLVTAGYNVGGNSSAGATSAAAASSVEPPIPKAAAISAAVPSRKTDAPSQPIDIGGMKLGMSPDEVRAVLKSKNLLDYNESAETLGYLDPAGLMHPIPNGRFVNVIAAWTPPPSSAGDTFEVDGESYQVMFTPVPGKERAMAIIHSVGYSPPNAIRESALDSGLIRKYGGFAQSSDLPDAPTWRLQSDGSMQVGDTCNRRGTFGGLAALNVGHVVRENLALKRAPEDFKSQVDHCGIAIVTEDHFTANGGALHGDRLVTRFTVTAYSPAMGFEDAKVAARLIQAAGGSAEKSSASRTKDIPASSL